MQFAFFTNTLKPLGPGLKIGYSRHILVGHPQREAAGSLDDHVCRARIPLGDGRDNSRQELQVQAALRERMPPAHMETHPFTIAGLPHCQFCLLGSSSGFFATYCLLNPALH